MIITFYQTYGLYKLICRETDQTKNFINIIKIKENIKAL
jgi:hypothetical protein